MIYSKLSTDDKPNFGIRNKQFARYLTTIGLPYIEIDCPPIHALKKLYPIETICERHTSQGVCSVFKAELLRKWILDK